MNSYDKKSVKWWGKTVAFLVSQGVTLFGSQIVQMAIIWYVTLETSSGLWVTVLTLTAFLPQMLVSFFAGVWADRYDRKWIIIISDIVIAATTLLLALYMMSGNVGEAALPAIIIVCAVRSLGSGIQTPTVNAMLPQLVPEDGLMRVNGINGSIQAVVQFVSPVAAGAIMAAGPIYNIMLIDVATAVIGVSMLFLIRIPRHQPQEGAGNTPVLKEIGEGLRFTWRHKFLRRMLIQYGAYIFLCVPSGFLTALMIQRTFGDNIMLLTINETVGFAGALAGGLLLGATGGFKNRNMTFFLGAAIYGVTSFAVGFTSTFWLFASLMFFMGMTIPVVQSAVFTLVQEKTEPAMLGRVFSLLNVMFTGFMPLGMVIFGPLADRVRIQFMVIVCAFCIILLAMGILTSREYYRGGLADATAETEQA